MVTREGGGEMVRLINWVASLRSRRPARRIGATLSETAVAIENPYLGHIPVQFDDPPEASLGGLWMSPTMQV